MEKRIEGDETLFWKSQKTQATTEGKQNKGESKFE
jgi:hypothetical protein